MTQQHSPAPWTAIPSDEHTEHAETELATVWGGWSIVAPINRETNRFEDEANARLIAAAPELLYAAQAALSYIQATSRIHPMMPRGAARICERLEAAIAKAQPPSAIPEDIEDVFESEEGEDDDEDAYTPAIVDASDDALEIVG